MRLLLSRSAVSPRPSSKIQALSRRVSTGVMTRFCRRGEQLVPFGLGRGLTNRGAFWEKTLQNEPSNGLFPLNKSRSFSTREINQGSSEDEGVASHDC